MAVYSWGSTEHGELGLGGIEDEHVLTPREVTWSEAPHLAYVSCGATHTLFLTTDGKAYSCGNNDQGQLGHDLSKKRPQFISALENYSIVQVCCGNTHSMAVNEWGQLFTWGSNNTGQLGTENGENQPIPKLVRVLATKHVVQIACGQYHCLALTNGGDIFAWGSNAYGQCGLGMTNEKITKPTAVKSLSGVPIAFIACGGNHSFAVSKSGAVFGWGKNVFGQIGINDNNSRPFPTQLKTLRSLGVRYIACGDDFSVFLTKDGGVFTCGNGTFGQLGHGGCNNEILPRMVMELMGSTVTQISCGKRHTLALVPSRGKVYAFGIGGSGQLGNRTPNNSNIPQVVVGPWVAPNGSTLVNRDQSFQAGFMIKRIFSGGDRCFVTLVPLSKHIPPDDLRQYDEKSQICYISDSFAESFSDHVNAESLDQDFLTAIETIFKNASCINGSFLLSNDRHLCCTSKRHGLNMDVTSQVFESIQMAENETLKEVIWESITNELLSSLTPSPPDVEAIRIYLILPLYHEFMNCKHYKKLHSPFSKSVLQLDKIPQRIIACWWAEQSSKYFERLVENYKSVVIYIMHSQFRRVVTSDDTKQLVAYEVNLENALNLLAILNRINHTQRTTKVPYEVFQIPELNESVDVRHEYVNWVMDRNYHNFHLCNYPFLFDAPARMTLLQTDQAIQMNLAMQNAANQGFMYMFSGAAASASSISQYIVLNVTRENIVEDTIRELANYGASDLKKPLKVKFCGEEAEDAGGVRKEFFMLLLKDILDPKYGMFKCYEESRAIWFSEDSFEGEEMYLLIGIICGLAIYNFTIINLPFPLALYKKLLKEPVDLDDLNDLSPVLANSMRSLLDYKESDLEGVFGLTFEITRECFGETKTVQLKSGGDKIAVTQENKQEFVDLYIDFIFNKAVESQFNGFYKGFMKVCGGRVLELFRPHELMAVVIGNEEYDWHELEAQAEYKNGYVSSDQTIRWFWEVFHELSLDEKKKFLLFLTGSDRIPIQGMKAIKIFIQPTNDDKCLPVAHTCFNLLDLPRYGTKERLRYKLVQAIQQTQGFSLV